MSDESNPYGGQATYAASVQLRRGAEPRHRRSAAAAPPTPSRTSRPRASPPTSSRNRASSRCWSISGRRGAGPCKQLHAGAGKGRRRGRRQGQAGQDEHRRASVDRRPARHPVDPGGHRLQERPAGRRLHGRHSREPDPRVHPEGGRQEAPAADRRGACRGRAGARGGRPADGRRHLSSRARSRRPRASTRSPGLPTSCSRPAMPSGASECWTGRPRTSRTPPAIAAVRAKIALAAEAADARRSGRARAPARRRIPRTIRRASTSP